MWSVDSPQGMASSSESAGQHAIRPGTDSDTADAQHVPASSGRDGAESTTAPASTSGRESDQESQPLVMLIIGGHGASPCKC